MIVRRLPYGIVCVHETKIWPQLQRWITPIEFEEYERRIKQDQNPTYSHDTHFHFTFGE
jgi:hypothetical protein